MGNGDLILHLNIAYIAMIGPPAAENNRITSSPGVVQVDGEDEEIF